MASVNIESVYKEVSGNDDIFKGICLTDTFQLAERDDSDLFAATRLRKNVERLERQMQTPLHVIISNPPYSVGQKSANDNAQNMKYERLDGRIEETYAARSDVVNKKSLYDSYIRAFRWASDRVDPENGGIIAFIMNSGWVDGNAAAGFRKCLEEEFSSVYVLDLKGALLKGKEEGGNVFDIKTGVAITILVKNHTNQVNILYKNIGDSLSREEKFERLRSWRSIQSTDSISITSNEYGDWVNQRTGDFQNLIPIEPLEKLKKGNKSFLELHSSGLKTNRDVWCYNFSIEELTSNIKATIDFYNGTLKKLEESGTDKKNIKDNQDLLKLIEYNSKKISWTRGFLNNLRRKRQYRFNSTSVTVGVYRPFFKQQCYFNKQINENTYRLLKIFPQQRSINLVVCINGVGSTSSSFPVITDVIPNLHIISSTQCFSLYYYTSDGDDNSHYTRHDAITDYILNKYQNIDAAITKEDIFYSVYGFLHSQEYLKKYEADLKKSPPRLPLLSKDNF